MTADGPADTAAAGGPDLDAAHHFLHWLDGEAERFTFQTFADTQAAKDVDRERKRAGQRPYYARILTGSLDDHADVLAQLNHEGAGVFVTVNRTRGGGRKAADVDRVRALFVDLDGAPLDPVLEFEPRPHVVVESSPGKYHAYWLTNGDDVPVDEFGQLQKALAHALGGDTAVHDLPRVMRLPGFAHRKHGSTPSVVLRWHDDERVTADQMRAALADWLDRVPAEQHGTPSVGRSTDGVPELERLAERDCEPRPDPRNPGKWFVVCPWSHEHTAAGDGTDTAFYEAHTNGYAGAAFVCQHAHCAGRDIHALRQALGVEDRSRDGVMADARRLDRSTDADRVKDVLRRAATLDAIDREEVVDEVAAATKKSKTALKQQVKQYARREADGQDAVDRLNERHAVVRMGGKTAVMTEYYDRASGQHDIAFSTPGDMRAWYANDVLADGTCVFDAWMESPRRRQYDDIVFEPGADTPGQYNLWRGFAVEPDPDATCELFLQHVHEVVCSGSDELYAYVMAWMADAVQNPGHRPGTSVVMRGGMGVGKGIVANMLGRLFGQHFVPVRSPRYLTGNFNAHLKHALIVFADEAFWAGDKSAEGVLKGMITEPTLFIEAKNYDQIQIPNRLRLLIASNEDWVVPAGLDERRFVVIDVAEHRKNDLQWFNRIAAERDRGGLGALLHWLQTYDLSGVDLRRLPRTRGTAAQKMHSADPVVRWWHERLLSGAVDPEQDSWPDEVSRERAYTLYQQHCDAENVRGRRLSRVEFGRSVQAMCGAELRRVRRSGQRGRVFVLPTLDEARRRFEQYLGGSPVDWDEHDDGGDGDDTPY